MSTPALFLDRDGVINKRSKGYINKPEDFELCDGIVDVVRAYTQRRHVVIVVTNQLGVSLGHLSEDDLQAIHAKMVGQFALAGITIAAVYACRDASPTHRKPAPGMILDAARHWDIDLAASTLIGDSYSDIEAGKAAGVGTNILIESDRVADLLEAQGALLMGYTPPPGATFSIERLEA